MLKHIFFTLLAFFGISTISTAQTRIAQEVGVIAGPVTFQSDYGQRNNFDTNVGNTGFGVGIVHFINFSAANNRESFFTEHFKFRSELSFNKTDLQHFGRWVNKNSNSIIVQQLRAMSASSTLINIGGQLEFSPIKIHDFENNIGSFSPYASLGFQASYYKTKTVSSLGLIDLPGIVPGKYLTPSDGRPHGFSNEDGIVLSATAGIGVHYKLTDMSDLMFESRFQIFNSDWVDGLNPNKELYKENKSNDWQVWFNFGYIYYLEF
jgi:hypothetical protein